MCIRDSYESADTPVAERGNMLYAGCFITGGSGRAVVTGVGDHTEFGKIARGLSSTEASSTPCLLYTSELFKYMIFVSINTVDEYNDRLFMVSQGKMTMEELQAAEDQ